MPQRGFIVEQNPLNIVTFRQFLRDLTVGSFAPLLLGSIHLEVEIAFRVKSFDSKFRLEISTCFFQAKTSDSFF